MTERLALRVVRELAARGVREFCVCPGARNAPLLAAIDREPAFRVFRFIEERSAAFFGLGRIKATGEPVAVVTTSGTAAAELLPATMEAYYEALPLVLVTADRPRRLRGTGAPQSPVQPGLYGMHVEESLDVEGEERPVLAGWSLARPIHVNVCFEEPVDSDRPRPADPPLDPPPEVASRSPDGGGSADAVLEFLATVRRPLVLVGPLGAKDRDGVLAFLERLGAPAWLEAPSGLRETPRLDRLRVLAPGKILERAASRGYVVDGVLRIGAVPTIRLFRDLEELGGRVPVLSVAREPFPGLSHGRIEVASPGRLLAALPTPGVPGGAAAGFLDADRALRARIEVLLESEPRSEPALVRALSARIPAGSLAYLGNSLPVREWDLAATFEERGLRIEVSRGMNGIDGQVSTFLGLAAGGARGEPADRDSLALLGDLTALYDLAAPWVLRGLVPTPRATIAVLNNGGGRIFARMFRDRAMQSAHALSFRPWADLWGLPYERWDEIPPDVAGSPGPRVVEIVPDGAATARFWSGYDALAVEQAEEGA